MFSYAAGLVVESFYRFNLTANDKVVYQAHEWMTGLGALYLQKAVPEIVLKEFAQRIAMMNNQL